METEEFTVVIKTYSYEELLALVNPDNLPKVNLTVRYGSHTTPGWKVPTDAKFIVEVWEPKKKNDLHGITGGTREGTSSTKLVTDSKGNR